MYRYCVDRPGENNKKILGDHLRFVTLTNKKYIPGTLAMINSMKINSGIEDLKFTVVTEPDVEKSDRGKIKSLGVSVKFVSRQSLGELDAFDYFKPEFKVSLQKLLILKLKEPLIYFIDSDMICLRDVSEMLEHKHFTSTLVFGRNMKTQVLGRPHFSGGKFCIAPSQELFSEVIEFLNDNPDIHYRLADQTVMNYFMYTKYPNDVHLLDIEWEMINHLYKYRPVTWQSRKPRFIHYCNNKPWLGGVGPKYRPIEKLWWGVYIQ
jgi:lipopolysaccharide biosynthesis glycosyltransferase